jgi:hypothetical protein
MKNSTLSPQKQAFLTIDFYLQCFFFGLVLIFGVLSLVSPYYMIIGIFVSLPIMLFNSVSLIYHIFKGSYSKQVEIYRKIHAISAIIFLATFVVMFFIFDYPANENSLTLIIFWGIPPLFLITYFFITWKDWKIMKKLNN